jgi:acyl-coenzyme A thioesterase PaaI-like protein
MSDFIHSFLFDDIRITHAGDRFTAAMVMDSSKEGWVGIPHGGIGMGAIMEFVPGIGFSVSDKSEDPYPVSCSFRMGGSEARVGDAVVIEAETSNAGTNGHISVEGSSMPYITGDIVLRNRMSEKDDYTRSYVPSDYSQIEGKLDHLPHYRNCFVCGVDRKLPGLKRRFHLWKSPEGNIVCAFAGFNDEDQKTFYRFERNGFIHPMGMMAVLDETMGWAGFFSTANGAVSVRLNYSFLRKIRTHEKLVFFGRSEKVMGRINRRMLFWASGCGAVMKDDGSFEKVVESSGQWYAMAELTDQMRTELIPQDLTENAFAIARAKK